LSILEQVLLPLLSHALLQLKYQLKAWVQHLLQLLQQPLPPRLRYQTRLAQFLQQLLPRRSLQWQNQLKALARWQLQLPALALLSRLRHYLELVQSLQQLLWQLPRLSAHRLPVVSL
jgi:hypothetical protein